MPIMELFIETLTGTAFELRVSPFETIMSVKAKIQRLEGIPITQQHLIWQSSELEDDYCLHDYSIHDGATLKLVLQMRGGPINTRRIPVDDPALREMAEYMEANRDEIFEKLPSSNRQVTLLVFREGDQLNFFRVVDRGDGTLTPLSESLSGTSVYNLYDEDDDVDCQTKEKLEENDKLKEKMVSLRNKMETLTVHKKPKTTVISASDARPESRTRLRQIPSATALNLQPLNRNPCLPPVGSLLLPAKHLPDDSRSSVSPLSPLQKHSGSEDSPSPVEQSLTDFKSVDKNNSIDCSNLDQSSPIKKQTDSGSSKHNSKTGLDLKYGLYSVNEDTDNIDDAHPSSSSCGETLQHTGAAYSSANTNFRDEVVKHRHLPHPPSIKKPNNPKRDSKELKDLNTFPPASSRLNRIRESNQKERNKNDLSLDSFREALGRCSRLNDTKDFNYDSFQDFLHRSPPPSSKYPSAERKKEFTIESLSTSEARAMSGLLRQASIERLGSSCIGNYVTSASKPRYSRGTSSGLKESRMVTPDSRRVSAHLQRLSASRDGRIPSPSHRLPPVKAKKKSHKRCFMCTKKTGLATSYQCRCGNNFCAAHRYAEAHECTFDYKTEGRKLLEQANPVVSAPKLPKI